MIVSEGNEDKVNLAFPDLSPEDEIAELERRFGKREDMEPPTKEEIQLLIDIGILEPTQFQIPPSK